MNYSFLKNCLFSSQKHFPKAYRHSSLSSLSYVIEYYSTHIYKNT